MIFKPVQSLLKGLIIAKQSKLAHCFCPSNYRAAWKLAVKSQQWNHSTYLCVVWLKSPQAGPLISALTGSCIIGWLKTAELCPFIKVFIDWSGWKGHISHFRPITVLIRLSIESLYELDASVNFVAEVDVMFNAVCFKVHFKRVLQRKPMIWIPNTHNQLVRNIRSFLLYERQHLCIRANIKPLILVIT